MNNLLQNTIIKIIVILRIVMFGRGSIKRIDELEIPKMFFLLNVLMALHISRLYTKMKAKKI